MVLLSHNAVRGAARLTPYGDRPTGVKWALVATDVINRLVTTRKRPWCSDIYASPYEPVRRFSARRRSVSAYFLCQEWHVSGSAPSRRLSRYRVEPIFIWRRVTQGSEIGMWRWKLSTCEVRVARVRLRV